MQGKVITLATSKGGAGKSTLVRNIAAHWFHIGMNVAVIDADPQGSVITRHDPTGPLGNLTILSEPEETVGALIEDLKRKHNLILVDTGGFRNKTTIRALVATDIAIIPLKPSADDVSGALETHNLVKEINSTPERINNPIKYRMILTMSAINMPNDMLRREAKIHTPARRDRPAHTAKIRKKI